MVLGGGRDNRKLLDGDRRQNMPQQGVFEREREVVMTLVVVMAASF